ncbi:MAG TPA: hypothetical protein VIP98_24355 [Microlunatus sp.]
MHVDPDELALLAIGERIGAAERHLSVCPQCAEELKRLTAVAQRTHQAMTSEPMLEPPAAVWQRTAAELQLTADPYRAGPRLGPPDRVWQATLRQLHLDRGINGAPATASEPFAEPAASDGPVIRPASHTDATARQPRPPSRRRRAIQIAVAAGIAAVVGFAGGILLPGAGSTPEIVSRAELAAQPQWPGSSGTAEVEITPSGTKVLSVDLRTDQTFAGNREVWLATADLSQMRSVGYLNSDSGSYQIPAGLDLTAFTVVDVSAEPKNDPSPGHSPESIVRGELQS